MSETDCLELSIDSASAMTSIALSRDGILNSEVTWDCERDHTRQLLPAIDSLLITSGLAKADLAAIFVCVGPGSYGGLRAGLSAAKGLADALDLPVAGVGRLEIEAHAYAAVGGPVAAVHRAGRSQLAWATYAAEPEWREVAPPRLGSPDELASTLPGRSLVTGDIDNELAAALTERGHRVVRGAATMRHAALLAELGAQRLRAGRADDRNSLAPLYLREPAIGPQS
jgi:tRNA threonylcarbamoyl adenosine modification protein YeaZ